MPPGDASDAMLLHRMCVSVELRRLTSMQVGLLGADDAITKGRIPGKRMPASSGRPDDTARCHNGCAARLSKDCKVGRYHSDTAVMQARPPPWHGRPRAGSFRAGSAM